jgi:hypothetical protein
MKLKNNFFSVGISNYCSYIKDVGKMEYEGRGKNLKRSEVGCSLKKMVRKKPTPFGAGSSYNSN